MPVPLPVPGQQTLSHHNVTNVRIALKGPDARSKDSNSQ
jgi:hypothetical protein